MKGLEEKMMDAINKMNIIFDIASTIAPISNHESLYQWVKKIEDITVI